MMDRTGRIAARWMAVLTLLGSSMAANAALLTPFDTDGLVLGSPIATLVDDFTNGVGTLESNVYLGSDGVYTYTLAFSPGIGAISELNTAFSVSGLISDGTEVGFSFSDTAAAGGLGTADDVSIMLDPDGTLDFEINGSWFGMGDTVVFHFRSLGAPIETDYNAINGRAGIAKGLGPDAVIPLPGAVWLLISAFGALAALRRR